MKPKRLPTPTLAPALVLAFAVLTGCAGPRPVTAPEATPQPPIAPAPQPEPANPPPDSSGDSESAPEPDFEGLPLDATIPRTPEVLAGRLDNGLSYFIRRNAEPAQRAELRLAVDVGSVLEEEDERGLSHFLEHMLFNGTERFPGTDLVTFLEDLGMEFGPEVNAFTSFDETVYQLKIPTDDPATLATALDVMEDWAHRATLDPDEVDEERGVILEERRLRELNAQGRIREQTVNLLLEGSRYPERFPIGDPEVIRTVSPEELDRFYRKWYRPDNMAVIAVGDFDPQRVESLIRERFGGIVPPEAPPERPELSIPQIDETRYAVFTDPEQPLTLVQTLWRSPFRQDDDLASYRERLVGLLLDDLINGRLFEAVQREDAPMLQASADRSNPVRPVEIYQVTALAPQGKAPQALKAALVEVERVRRHGFTEGELRRAKDEILSQYLNMAAEVRNTPSVPLAEELVRHFLEHEAVPGIAGERALVERFLPGITVDDLDREIARTFGTGDRMVVVLAPENGSSVPDRQELSQVVDAVAAREITPYEDTLADAELMPDPPEPGEIVERSEIPELGVVDLRLANGVRVLYKATDFRQEQVLFSAVSPGGSSLVPDGDVPEADVSTIVATQSGIADFSVTDLVKLLAGRQVGVEPFLNELTEGFDGGARVGDLPLLFQLVHLYVTEPRLSEAAFEQVRRQLEAYVENATSVPDIVLEEAVTDVLYGDTPRRGLLAVEEIRELDFERSMEIYRDRFADMGDFTFIFTGAFDPAELELLARTYLGTLPSAGRQETYRDRLPDPPEGIETRLVRKGRDQRAQVRLVIPGPVEDVSVTPRLRLEASLLEQILQDRIQGELRGARSGVYGAQVSLDLASQPEPESRLTLDFTCDPARLTELVTAAMAEIEDIRTHGPGNGYLSTAREKARRQREEALSSNEFWRQVLENWAQLDDDPREVVLDFDEILAAVTPERMRELATLLVPKDRYVQVVLLPEE